MSGAVIVLVLVATSEAHAPATTSMLRAAAVALGDTTTLVVREVSAQPDDDAAVATASSAHASALAEVSWGDPKHLVARVRVHVDGVARWSDRELGFEAADDETERGRTVGYALASMLPEHAPETPPPSVPPASPPAPSPPPVASPPSRETVVAPARTAARGSIDVAAVAGVGLGGDGGGFGAAVAGRWNVSRQFALRLGFALRAGDVDVAAATSKTYVGALGAAWHLDLAPIRGLSFGARTDFLVIREELSHFDFDDTKPSVAARWVPGADLLAESDWRFTDSASIFLAVGGEAAFGTTDVFLAGVRVTDIPALRGVGELGVRARF